MTTAPATLVALQKKLVKNLGTTNLGIVGDASHVRSGGYHIGAKSLRNAGMSGDYSLEYALDKNSTTDYACAIDIGGSSAKLQQLGSRLVTALKNKDARVYGKIRGTNAPWGGDNIDRRYDCESPTSKTDDNTQVSSDRNHIHIEFYRTLILEQSVMDGLYDVLAGVPAKSTPKPAPKPTPKPAPKPVPKPAVVLLKNGSTGAAVKALQTFMNKMFPSYRNSVTVKKGKVITVDGIYGSQTVAWVKEFQKRVNISADGIVGGKTLAKLEGYGYKP